MEFEVKLQVQNLTRPLLLLKIASWFTLLLGVIISGIAQKDADVIEAIHNVSTNALGSVYLAFSILGLIISFFIMLGSICINVSGCKQKDMLFHFFMGITVIVSTLFLFGAAIELEVEQDVSPGVTGIGIGIGVKGWRGQKPYRQNHRYAGICFSFCAGILYVLTAKEIRRTRPSSGQRRQEGQSVEMHTPPPPPPEQQAQACPGSTPTPPPPPYIHPLNMLDLLIGLLLHQQNPHNQTQNQNQPNSNSQMNQMQPA